MDIDDPALFTDGETVLTDGCEMSEIYRWLSPWEFKNVTEIYRSSDHKVLFKMPLSSDHTIPPEPFKAETKWDSIHVRLPCSPMNQYAVSNPDGTEEIKDRWTLIKAALEQNFQTSLDLEAAILSYNAKYSKVWRFRGLHKLILEMSEDGRLYFFGFTLPNIIQLALELPKLILSAVPLLKIGTNKSVSFSQQQVASLLANAFLCTFPRRNTQKKNSEYRAFPDINFNRLFQSTDSCVIEKIKCVLHYFQRVTSKVPTGVVTVTRRHKNTKHMPDWENCSADFNHVKLHVAAEGTIEDQGVGLLQVDFANKYLGGGVLGQGCVQEEIRFVICPELFVTKLIAEVLQPNEALLIVGCERFSCYNGYASSFTFAGEFDDKTPWDDSRRRQCTIVAVDALNFHKSSDQYREDLMRRELNKAFVGYNHYLNTPAPALATGNWGCGAFGGEKRLKALLQLIVCATVPRPMVYFTFGDLPFRQELLNMWHQLRQYNITVAQLWSYLKKFKKASLPAYFLYPFILQSHQLFLSPPTNKNKVDKNTVPSETTSTSAGLSSVGYTLGSTRSSTKTFRYGSAATTVTQPSGSGYRLGSAPSAAVITQPKAKCVQSSLLSYLDNDYFGRNHTDTMSTLQSQPKPPVDIDSQIGTAITSAVDNADIPNDSHIEDERRGDTDDIFADVDETDDAATLTPGQKIAVVAVEEDDFIPATPPLPPQSKTAPERKSMHERQKKISDFLLRK